MANCKTTSEERIGIRWMKKSMLINGQRNFQFFTIMTAVRRVDGQQSFQSFTMLTTTVFRVGALVANGKITI